MNKNSKNYQDWLVKARNELKAARGIFGYYEQPPTDMVCYHCHQVAEKALKGYLVFQGVKFPKIHDLVALLNLCLRKKKAFVGLKESVEVLNQYYIEAKYPPDMPIEYSKEEAKQAIVKAASVLKTITSKIRVPPRAL